MSRILVFETTHHALWAEQVAQEEGIAAQTIPAPSGTRAKCGLALEAVQEDVPRLLELLQTRGIPFELFGTAEA